MIQQMIQTCDKCGGTGEVINPEMRCKVCNGQGFSASVKSINFPLKNGIDDGNKVQMERKGHNLKDGKTDLIIVINVIPDENFERNGTDLVTEMTIELYQSLFGFDKILKHLDNELLHISSSSKIEDNTIKKISNKGMVDLRTKRRGDLYIKFKVRYPKIEKFSNEEINLVKKILAKDFDIELQMENDIKNGKIQSTKTMLEGISRQRHRYQQSNSDEGTPQCTQQ